MLQTSPYISPSKNGPTCNAEYVNDSFQSGEHHPFFFLAKSDIYTVIT